MTIARAAAAFTLTAGLLLGLGACSSDSPDPDATSADETTEPQDDETSADADDSDDGSEDTTSDDETFADSTSTNIASSCEEFNTLMSDIRVVESADSEAFEDIYFRAQEARDAAPIETYDLFTAVSLLALDASLGEESQETADALRDAVFASSGPCTDEGVTLTV